MRPAALPLAAALAAGALLLGAAPARAQRAPDFATLDRADGYSRIGVDGAYVALETPPWDAVLRLDLFGQYVAPSGLGLYGSLPLARSVSDGDDETALGALELGALYVVHGRDISVALRGGLGLPTAGDGLDEMLVNLLATQARLGDYALTVPDAVYGRLAFSPLVHTRGVFFRLDLGLDIPLSEGDVDADALLRLNLGAGVDLGVVALMAELVNIASTDEFAGEEDFLHTVALSARFMGQTLQPFVAVGVPLDGSTRDAVDFFVSLGLQVVVP